LRHSEKTVLPLLLDSATTSHLAEPSSTTELANLPAAQAQGVWGYQYLDSKELGRRLALPESWIRDQVRSRAEDPLPFVPFGKYVRFAWGSPELEAWIRRRMMMGCNRRTGRVQ
jgi:hypothetical protein